jgi:NAD(P)-dependent dehydrogenase (short-subunit alcohol dehydrogenase family)
LLFQALGIKRSGFGSVEDGLHMKNKVALVIGGSSGIGRATALAFAREGARVAIASRSKTKAIEAVKAIEKLGVEVTWIQTDVSNAARVRQMVHQTVARFGRIDYAFNNGGSGGKSGWPQT